MSKRDDAPALTAPNPSNTRPLLVPSKSTVVSCPTERDPPVQQPATATRIAMQILIPILPSREHCNYSLAHYETPLRSLRRVIGPSNPSQRDDYGAISAIFASHAELKKTIVRAFRERPDVPPSID